MEHIFPYLLDSGTLERYTMYWTNGANCYFYNSAGARTYVNFFNTNDYALTILWKPDQDSKPDVLRGYGFDGTNFNEGYVSPYTLLLSPADTYEIFSACDEARCNALGAQADVGGVFDGNQVELDIAPYSFQSQHIYHSGEFRSDNEQRWQFWNEILIKSTLKQP